MYNYSPKVFSKTDILFIKQFVLEVGFATLISVDELGEHFVSHIPLLVESAPETTKQQNDQQQNAKWRFSFHLGKANKHAAMILHAKKNMLIVNGPHAYISPQWHTKKQEVPTWDYLVAHFEGSIKALNQVQLRQHLTEQVDKYETKEFSDEIMATDYVSQLAKHIGGFVFEASSHSCNGKLSQNKSAADQSNIKVQLLKSTKLIEQDLSKWF